MNKIKLTFHKLEIKRLLTNYIPGLQELSCGHKIAIYTLPWVNELEVEIDKHIIKVNELDNKSFKLFKDGYLPQGVFN